MVSVVFGSFGTVPKGSERQLEVLEIGGRTETIQIAVLLRPARILRRVIENWGGLLSLGPCVNWRNNNNNNTG